MNDLPFATWVTVSLLAAYLPAAVKIASNHSRMSNKSYSVSSGLARDAQISVHRLSERLTTYSGREAMVIFETWLPDIYGILSDCLRTLDWLRRSYTLLINYQLQCALEGRDPARADGPAWSCTKPMMPYTVNSCSTVRGSAEAENNVSDNSRLAGRKDITRLPFISNTPVSRCTVSEASVLAVPASFSGSYSGVKTYVSRVTLLQSRFGN